jgi:hypothetical protein
MLLSMSPTGKKLCKPEVDKRQVANAFLLQLGGSQSHLTNLPGNHETLLLLPLSFPFGCPFGEL